MNYFNLFIEGLKEWSDIQHNQNKIDQINLYSHLINLMGEKNFNTTYQNYFLDDEDDEDLDFDTRWYNFHKSMRQTDFYDIGEGHVDMIFWNFCQISEIPYKTFKTFTERIKKGDDTESWDIEPEGWDKFGFFLIR